MKPRTKTKDCRCERCKAWKRIARIASGLSRRDSDFIIGMFDALLELANMRDEAGKN